MKNNNKRRHTDVESVGDYKPIKPMIPELSIGKMVYIINKEHPLFLEQGKISDKRHCHYRVKFVSQNKGINNTYLWVPEHWIDPLPKEMLKDGNNKL
jgi:hypothetical protein